MTDIPFNLLLDTFVFLLFPLLGGYVAVRFKISPLIGYIIGGILLHLFFGARLPKDFISNFSILGLVLLVFTIGLETNFSAIRRFGRFVILGGFLQIVLSGILISLLSLIFKMQVALLGGLTIGVLIFQDLAFIPLLIILSSFGKDQSALSLTQNVIINSLKAALILLLVYYVGQKLIPVIFDKVAKVSREILNLFIIVFILASLTVFSFFGLSSLLAAFIAGVLVGQTLEHYHIFSQIRPLRDMLAIIFFVFLGLTLEPAYAVRNIFLIGLFTFFVVIIKMGIVLLIYLFFRFHSRTAFSLSVFLFEIGEDAFILIYQGLTNGVIRTESYYFAVSVVLLTLLITPFMIHKKEVIYGFIRRAIRQFIPSLEKFITFNFDRESPNIDVLTLKNHVILCGYGRVGRYIGRALMLANIPFIAIDYNFHTVEKAKQEGVNIIYGDPTEIDVLDYAECENSNMLIAAVPENFSQETIIFNAKRLNPKIVIFTRVHREDQQRRMRDLGVQVVIQPEFEASLSIIRRVFLWKGMEKTEVAKKIKRLKIEHGMA
ncbi:cation:proton antiporter [Candidatus Roizmanbacteria bacterium]|nr:cation:proton antiporter [Candidatus Roizmanbacteria bacterium]